MDRKIIMFFITLLVLSLTIFGIYFYGQVHSRNSDVDNSKVHENTSKPMSEIRENEDVNVETPVIEKPAVIDSTGVSLDSESAYGVKED